MLFDRAAPAAANGHQAAHAALILASHACLSAEPLAREERQRLLERVAQQGYIDDYNGVRISRTGRRFLIERATVWNLLDPVGQVVGQAAAFASWLPVESRR